MPYYIRINILSSMLLMLFFTFMILIVVYYFPIIDKSDHPISSVWILSNKNRHQILHLLKFNLRNVHQRKSFLISVIKKNLSVWKRKTKSVSFNLFVDYYEN